MVLSSAIPTDAARRQFVIGTGFIGSSMHALGTVLAKHMQQNLRMRVTARPYVGPSAFIPLINSDELEMGLSSMGEARVAYLGIDTDPKKNIRTVARIMAMPFAFIVREDSDIKNIADLRGKKVVLDFAAAQAMTDMSTSMLRAAGLSRDDVEVITVSGVGPGVEAVVEGNADAAPASVTMSATRKADATVGIRVLDLASENFEEKLGDLVMAGIRPYIAPAGTLPGVETDMQIFALDMFIVVPAELEEEDVNKILDGLHNSWTDIQNDYAGLAAFDPSGFVHSSQTVPYHPAAIKYYKSGKGSAIWDDDAEKRNQQLLDIWN
jgi:TRAP transporter TAXI family solute receptor